MSHPQGKCPVCNEAFKDGDDVVICPDCGAPYHRACYQRAGSCVFSAQHGPGFEYKAPEPAAKPAAADASPGADAHEATQGPTSTAEPVPHEHKGILCPNCRTINEDRAIFCLNCGAPLHPDAFRRGGQAPQNGTNWVNPPPGGFFGAQGAAYGPQMDTTGEIDGISKRDWATFIGKSAITYLQRMTQMDLRKSKIGIMMSAFFISPFYFAYRKMWAWAALALFAELLFMCPTILLTLAEGSLFVVPWLSLQTLSTIAIIASYLSLAMRVVFCLFALYLYRRDAGKKISLVRRQHDDDASYQSALAQKGGVSVPGVVAAVVISFVAQLVPYIIFGYDYLYALYPGLF